MTHFKNILLVITLFALCVSCIAYDDAHESIAIVNLSGKPIGCQMYRGKDVASTDAVYYGNRETYVVPTDSLVMFKAAKGKWEEDIRLIPYVRFIIMDGDSLLKYKDSPVDVVRKNVPILNVYKLKQDDLEKINWTIIYSDVNK